MYRLAHLAMATSFAATLALFSMPAASAADVNPVGNWRHSKGKLTIGVDYCGGQKLCARIVDLRRKTTKTGELRTDKENPDPALRSRPLIGIYVASGMVPAGDGRWRGTIYNADDGNTYSATTTFAGNRLVLKACVGPICKKQTFVKVN
jgi:uncharacterized protein (DUF2147 family)